MLKKLIYIINIIIINALLLTSAHAVRDKNTFALELKELKGQHLFLQYYIPKTHFTTPDMYRLFFEGFQPILEFIPIGEVFEEWSEIITVVYYRNHGWRSKDLTDNLFKSFTEGTEKTTVITHNNDNFDDFDHSDLSMQYMENGKAEMVYIRYYSGLYHTAGIQYAMKLDDWLAEKDAKKLVKKMSAKVDTFLEMRIVDKE